MDENNQKDKALDGLIRDIQVFIELSFQEDDISMNDWVKETVNNLDSRCWKSKQCGEENCPAYKNECGRCWLIAGTLCGEKPQGKFVEKYGFCTECEVYQDVIHNDQVQELRELIIALIHSLRLKQHELKAAYSKIKILNGFLPICSVCKKIRDDNGYWNQIESYIREHSEAEFSHSICRGCAKKYYTGLKP